MTNTLLHVKGSPLHFEVETTSEEAFISIIGTCLHHAEANRPAVLDSQVEGVHQMRVAYRRLRSCLKTFRDLVPREASTELVEDIRWLNNFLGPARDWDVFLEEGMAPLISHFPNKRGLLLLQDKAETIRKGHYKTLLTALAEPRYAAMRQRFLDWLEHHPWREYLDDQQQMQITSSALQFSTTLLKRQHRQVLKRGNCFAALSKDERHQLRIRIKELRYALDFFASLYPASAVKTYLKAMAQLQDCLGVLNDIVVTERLLDEAQLKARSVTRPLIEGWYGCRLNLHEQQFTDVWEQFAGCKRPWKAKVG